MAGLRGLVLFLLACAVFAKDKPVIVTAKLEWEASGLSGAPALKLPMTDSVLAGITPPKGLRKGLYGTLKLGKREFAIALDLSMSRPRTWIDSDGDNDLSDETSSTWSASGTRFEKVATIPIPVEGEADLVPVQIRLYRLQNCKPDHIHLFPQIHRRGSAILGGRVRAVALVDGNSDLSFDDEKQDRLYVDLDGDGRLDTRADSPELVLPGKAFRAGSRGYVAKLVSPAGHAVEFHPKSPAPPAPRRTWTARAVPQAGAKPKRPRESLRTLKKRFEREWAWEEVRRYGTVRLIGAVGSEDSFKFLVQIVNEDRSRLVRREAARAMGNRHYKPDHGHVTELAKKHAETIVRAAALDALHGMDAPFRQELYFELIRKSDQPTIVLACAKNLAYIGTGEAEMGVVSAAHDRGTPILRYQCYLGTQYFKAGPPLALARKSARDKYAPLRAAGIRDLHMMGREEAVGYARDAAKERPVQLTLALAAIEVLGVESDAPTIHTLLGLAEANNGRVTERLRTALGPNRTPRAIEAFLGALKSKEPAVRALSAEILAAIPDKRTTEKLLRLARKEKNEVALVAVLEALGDHEDPRALDTLLKIARSKDKVRRAAASRALARIGVNHPRVRKFFLRLFKSAIWQDRIFALDAAAAVGDASVAGNVIANLDHKQWQVRLAAVQALRSIRVAEAVEPVIVRLETEETRRVRAAAAEALFKITGQHFYDFADIWRRWWKENGDTFVVPKEVPMKRPPREGGTVASFFGLPLDSDRVIFVIDQSGSMSAADVRAKENKTRLDTARSEVLAAVSRLKDNDRINLILFETTIHPWRTKLTKLSARVRSDLESHLKKQDPLGGTNLYDGLEAALLTKGVDTVFLLSDGVPGSGKYVHHADIVRAVRRLNQTRRITIHCVSVGMQSSLLRELAASNGGKYVQR